MIMVNRGIKGPDLSFYQGDPQDGLFIDFQKMKNWRDENGSGINFVIIKAGQHWWKDPAFDYNWRAAKEAKIPRASYFFLDKDGDGKTQAQLYWDILKADPGEGPLIVDFEWGSGEWEHHLEDFLVELTRLSGYPTERIWIYTGFFYWQDHGPQTQAQKDWFLRHPLWLAWYTDDPADVSVPYPWLMVTLWQKGTTDVWGPDLGVHSLELDWNEFNGDDALFRRYFIYEDETPTPAPPEGGNMHYDVIWSRGVARRTAPTTENSYTGLIYSFGVRVEVIEDNIPDTTDPTNPNKKWVKFSDGRYGASEYPDSAGVARTRMVKVEAPTPGPTEPVIVHKIDIYSDGKIAVDNGDPF
jgi:GH25 family lysozyme M1 (1,4-beta-N-acetylmuramidase)